MLQTNLSRYRESLSKLIDLGDQMLQDLAASLPSRQKGNKRTNQKSTDSTMASFRADYQKWYTEAFAVLRQLLPERVEEFGSFYKPDSKRKGITAATYTIQDWLSGLAPAPNQFGEKAFDESAVVFMRYQLQVGILKSVEARFESSLFEIRQLVQADFFDSELDAARELLKSGFTRGAGAVAGVVLEKHLLQVSVNHNISITKKSPTIADLNDPLKNGAVIDIPTWRQVQRLADLRNLASHNKNREPTEDEVRELIDGTEKITKTLY
jgi:hypothetical protein